MGRAEKTKSSAFESFCGESDSKHAIEVEWHWDWCRPVARPLGVTGWATVVRSTDAAVAVGSVLRFHKCAQNPCGARWDASKYGVYGPPSHLRPIELFPNPRAAAGLEGAENPEPRAAQPAVAGAVPEAQEEQLQNAEAGSEPLATEVGTLVAAPEAPSADPANSKEVLNEPMLEAAVATALPEAAAGVGPPLAAVLPPAAAALPAALGTQLAPPRVGAPLGAQLPEGDAAKPAPDAEVVDLKSTSLAAEAAQANVLKKLVNAARFINRTCSYVGYHFFVLFALSKKCRPFMWEGEHRVDILETYAPWALEQDIAECAVDGVCCCSGQGQDGPEWVPVSEQQPLNMVNHFVAGIAIQPEMRDGNSLSDFYKRQGIAILPTVADGDCGLDTASMMLGLPQSVVNRDALREAIFDAFIIQHDISSDTT